MIDWRLFVNEMTTEQESIINPSMLLRVFILALAIYRESSGEPFPGKLAVGQVIETRVQDRRWPDNYRDVILQPWQFSAFNKKDPNVTRFPAENEQAWAESVRAAQLVLNSDDDFARGANHYFADYIEPPNWAKGKDPVLKIGRHIFVKL